MIPLLLLTAADPAPAELPAHARASADGRFVAVSTSWILPGPGFAVARVEVFDLAAPSVIFDVTVRDDAAGSSLERAEAAAWARASSTVAGLGPLTALPWRGGGAGCAAAVGVTEAPATAQECPEGVAGALPSLTVPVGARATPLAVAGCTWGWQVAGVVETQQGAVVLLGYTAPGMEGGTPRWEAAAVGR